MTNIQPALKSYEGHITRPAFPTFVIAFESDVPCTYKHFLQEYTLNTGNAPPKKGKFGGKSEKGEGVVGVHSFAKKKFNGDLKRYEMGLPPLQNLFIINVLFLSDFTFNLKFLH